MIFNYPILAAFVGAVVLQGAVGQVRSTPRPAPAGVSMQVVGVEGIVVGAPCEPFDCVPHQFTVARGDVLALEMYGKEASPYILFAGAPGSSCYTLPWVLGGVTMEPPFLIVEVGVVPPQRPPTSCGLNIAQTALQIPVSAPAGASLVLQTAAWPLDLGIPAFSRGVTLFAK